MSLNNDSSRPVSHRAKRGAGSSRNEAAKNSGKDCRESNDSPNGVENNAWITIGTQASGVPYYTRKKNDDRD